LRAYSLKRQLVVLVMGGVLVTWLFVVAAGYREAREEADETARERLEEIAKVISAMTPHGMELRSDRPKEADGDAVQVRVWDAAGDLLYATVESEKVARPAKPGHDVLVLDRHTFHAYTRQDPASGRWVQVLESAAERERLLRKLTGRVTRTLLLALPFLGLLTWLGIGRGLRPLTTLANSLARASPEHLQPVEPDRVPREVKPLVDALNRLLARISITFERERSFTADAAHELRTPLAGIKIQAEVAASAVDAAVKRRALSKVIEGVDGATRLVEQLLLLARLEQAPQRPVAPVDLLPLTVKAVAMVAGQAAARGMAISVDRANSALVLAPAASIDILLRNVLENAVRHGREGGKVEVQVGATGGRAFVVVKDDGPGVDAANLPHLTRRFFRSAAGGVAGSGLGLAIVQRIVDAYGGELSFSPGVDGAGLGVTISFASERQEDPGKSTL
jgi:two-component system sensor histidine kinase QseC